MAEPLSDQQAADLGLPPPPAPRELSDKEAADLGLPKPTEAKGPAGTENLIRKAYADAGVDPDLGVAIALHEGRGSLNAKAIANTGGDAQRGGSYGASQVSLQTARGLGFTGTPKELLDPAVNAHYSAALVAQLSKRFNGNTRDIISAYNSGKPFAAAPGITREEYVPGVLGYMPDQDPPQPAPAQPPPSDAALATFKAGASNLSPDQGAEALDQVQASGLGPIYVANNLDAVRAQTDAASIKATLAKAPVTASFMAQSSAHASAVKDDVDNLSLLEWIFGRFNPQPAAAPETEMPQGEANYSGPGMLDQDPYAIPPAWMSFYAKGMFSLRAALLGLKAGIPGVGLTEQDQENSKQAQELAAAPVPGTEGHLGREMVGASIEAVPQLAGFLAGGAPAAAFLFAQTYGQMHNQFSAQTKADGTPKYSEVQVRGLALGGATATTALLNGVGSRFAKGTVGAAAKLLPKAAQEAIGDAGKSAVQKMLLESPKLLDNLAGRASQFTQHALNGLAFMIGQSVANDLTDQAGELMTGGKFDVSKTVQAAERSVDSAMMLLPLMAIAPAAGALHDVGRAVRARETALDVATQIETAKESKLIQRSPEQAKTLLEAQAAAGGPERSTAYIPVAAFDAAMAERGVDPAVAAQDLVGDDGSAYQDAKTSGEALAAPMADVLTKLAKNGVADALLPDISLEAPPDGMSAREASQVTLPTREDLYRDFFAKVANAPAGSEAAQLYASAVERLAERSGLTPAEVARRFQFNIGTDAEGTMLLQAPQAGPLWHSALENAAISAKQTKGTPESWLAVLSKTPGVKAEEIEETGVKEWLAQQKGVLTREQVADYIKEHRVELQEKVLGARASQDEVDAAKVLAEGQPLFQQAVAGTPLTVQPGTERGSITIGPATAEGRAFTINLTNPDESTLAHEIYHGLSVMMADLAKEKTAAPDLVADHEALAKAMGYSSGAERQEKLDPAKEEKGATAFEQYLLEGKAPSPELAGVFARFKDWLSRIYQTIRGGLSDEMRGIFDRLFGTPPEEQVTPPRTQSPGLAAAGKRAKEARDLDTALAAYAAARIAKLKIGEIRPATYEQQAKVHAARMTELAKNLETARAGLAETKVITPQNQAGEPATYKLVEAKDLITSHTPDAFSPDARYPAGVQERDYLSQQGEQGKVVMGAQRLDPSLVLADTPTAVDGPPLVTSGAKAIVLGGNGRSMMLRRAYTDGPAGERYKEALRAKASAFGIAPEAVDAMKEPVLVRSIDAIPSTAKKADLIGAVRRFNEGLTQQLSPRLRAVAESRVLTPRTVASIGELLGKGDESLRDLLRSAPREFLSILERDGIVNDQNRAQWVTGGELTDEGKDRIEGMFLGRVMGSGERLQATAPSMSNKIERAVPSLLRVAGANPTFDEIGDVQGALDLINDAARRGLPLEDLLNQRTMFVEGRVEPRTIAMARLLEAKSGKDLAQRFKAWADAAAYDPRQPSMFGKPATPEEALQKLFAGQKDDISGESRPADSAAKTTEAPKAAPTFNLTPEAIEKKKTAQTAEASLREVQTQHLVADHLARAATDAQKAAKKIKDSLIANAKDEKRAPVVKADYEMAPQGVDPRPTPYTDGYDAILEAFGFRPRSGVPLSADAAIARIESDDRLNFDPDALRAILRKPPERPMRLGAEPGPSLDGLLMDEAKVVQAAVTNIRHAARAAIEVVRNEQRAQYADDVRRIVEFTANRPKPGLPSPSNAGKSGLEGIGARVTGMHAELLAPENILRNELGPVGEAYFDEYLKARSRGEDLTRLIGERVQQAIDAMPPEMKANRFDAVDGPPSPKLDPGKWVRQDLMMLFAWAGTESSMERATKGLGLTEEQLHQTFDQLTKQEKDFVQAAIWDLNDQVLKPRLLEQSMKNTGVPMTTIEAKAITTKDGEYRGGFHHASYNREASQKAAARAVVDGVADYYGDLKSGWATGPAKGFTKSRTQGFSDVPNLNWNSFGSHMTSVIHYLAVDDFVKAFGGLLRRPDFRAAAVDSIGAQKLKQLDEFAATVARGRAEAPATGTQELSAVLGGLFRNRVATSAFALNLRVVLMQLSHLGVAEAALKIRPDHMLFGVGKALNPWTWQAAHEASAQFGDGELGYRWNNYSDHMRAMLANLGPEGERTGRILRAVTGGERPGRIGQDIRDASTQLNRWVDAGSWALYHTMDGFLSLAIWHAANLKAIENGAAPEEAAKLADQGVRDTMPKMNLAESSAFARDRGVIGSLMLVKRFPNTIYNLAAMNGFQERTGVWNSSPGWNRAKAIAGGGAMAAGAYLGMTLSAHLIGRYMGGHGRRKDEGETNAQWIARQGLIGLAYPLPFGEEIATPFIEKFVNKKEITRDAVTRSFRAPPTIALLEDEIIKAGEALNSRKPFEDRLFSAAEVIMRLRGIPTAPLRQARTVYDLGSGKYRSRGALDVIDKLVYGPQRPNQKRETNPASDVSRALR